MAVIFDCFEKYSGINGVKLPIPKKETLKKAIDYLLFFVDIPSPLIKIRAKDNNKAYIWVIYYEKGVFERNPAIPPDRFFL